MTSTVFTSGTVIESPWLNDVNTKTYADTSNTVAYTPAGTSAVVTTVQAKLRQTVSVMDFGAVGNGVANDTTAIQAALDSGFNVFIPKGTYKYTSQLNITTNGQNIFGEGHGLTILSSATTSSITGLYSNNINNIVIKDLQLLGGETVYSANRYTGISINTGNYCSVVNCEVSKFTDGIKFSLSSQEPVAQNNIVHDCYYTGIMANGTSALRVQLPKFIGNTVYSIGTSSVAGGGIRTEETSGGIISNNTIHTGAEIRIENSTEIIVSANTVREARRTGIELYNYTKRCVVTGNNVFNCNTDNNTAGATDLTPNLGNTNLAGCGIALQYFCENNTITNNSCYNSSTGNGFQQYGVALNLRNFTSAAAGACSYNIISNNICVGNVVGGVLDRGFNNNVLNNINTLYSE